MVTRMIVPIIINHPEATAIVGNGNHNLVEGSSADHPWHPWTRDVLVIANDAEVLCLGVKKPRNNYGRPVTSRCSLQKSVINTLQRFTSSK